MFNFDPLYLFPFCRSLKRDRAKSNKSLQMYAASTFYHRYVTFINYFFRLSNKEILDICKKNKEVHVYD